MNKIIMWIVVVLAAFVGIMSLIGRINDYNCLYPMTRTVVMLNHTTDRVQVTDYTGNLWEFRSADDWEVGDLCAMMMDTNGTSSIYDDGIVSVRYAGR